MDIRLSQFAGFCDGVKRAYEMVSNFDISQAKKPVFVLGSLVHNPEVNRKIEEMGIEKIDREKFFAAKPGEIGTIIVTAHGIGPDIFEEAQKKGMDILNTTCPRVIKVQKLAELFFKKGYQLVLIGDRNHKEVLGIYEWGGKNAVLISDEEDLENLDVENGKIAVISQTTQDEDFCKKVAAQIKDKYRDREVKIIETTCHTTHERQNEIKKMARENEAILVIGSVTSANSKRLFEISRAINPLSFFIEEAGDIPVDKLKGIGSVGITAGASTPSWTIEEVIKTLEKL